MDLSASAFLLAVMRLHGITIVQLLGNSKTSCSQGGEGSKALSRQAGA